MVAISSMLAPARSQGGDMHVVVINHLSLDGVIQAPGRADEDTRGGFEHRRRSPAYGDALMGEVIVSLLISPSP